MKSNEYSGKLIAFCGVDGAGKTTLIDHIENVMKERKKRYYRTKMPSDRIRAMDVFRDFHDSHDPMARISISSLALTVLVSGDRMIVNETEVIPALKRGDWVLTDRYVFSGMACSDSQLIKDIAEEFIQPDIVFLADAKPETCQVRVKSREDEKTNFYDDEDVRLKISRFKEISRNYDNFVIINTEQDKDKMYCELDSHISKLF